MRGGRMSRIAACCLVPLLCATGVPRTAVAAAVPAATQDVRAMLRVDTSQIGGAGPILRQRLLERGGQAFRDENVHKGTPGVDPEVVVVVREQTEPDPGFAFEISIIRATKTSDAHKWSVQCRLCTETELVDRVAEELIKVAATLTTLAEPADARGSSVEATDEEPSRIEPSPAAEPEPSPAEPVPERRRLHPMTAAGIGVLSVGLVGAGVGIGLAVMPPQPVVGDPTRERYTQPPGYALIGVGGAALIAGAVLLALGLKRGRAGRVEARHGGLQLRF